MNQEATQGVLLRGADGKHYFIPHTDLSRYALEGMPETGGQLEAGAPRVTAFAVQQTGGAEAAAAFMPMPEDSPAAHMPMPEG